MLEERKILGVGQHFHLFFLDHCILKMFFINVNSVTVYCLTSMVHTSARFASVLSNTVNDLRQTPLGIDEIVRLRDMSVLERFLKY